MTDVEISTEVPEGIQRALDQIDKELKRLQKILKRVDPIIAQRDQLMSARRALLSTRSTTGGAGSPRTRLTMDEVVNALRTIEGPATVSDIAEKIPGVDPTAIRSHLNRHKGDRYTATARGTWILSEDDTDEEDEEDDD